MRTENTGYDDLIRAAIEREADVLGLEDAVQRANAVDGLSVSDDGTEVTLTGDGKAVLGDLVDAYVDASGDVAAFLIARRVENIPNADLDLPDNLDKHL